MIKEHYYSIENFRLKNSPNKSFPTNEGWIYITDKFVYKIFDDNNSLAYFRQKSNIINASRLSQNYITVPISLVYINHRFMGFKMLYYGENLNDLFFNDKLSLEELKDVSFQLKEIELYLRKKHLIHGDIQLNNILYRDHNIALTDINSFIELVRWYNFYKKYIINNSGGESLRIPGDYYFWLRTYGYEYLDYLATNYCTFLLLNFTPSQIENLNRKACERKIYCKIERFIDQAENKMFEDDVFDYFIDLFSGNKKKVLSDVYLIDHLK